MIQGIIPQKAGFGIGHGIVQHMGITSEPGTYIFLDIIRYYGSICPNMALGRTLSGGFVIVKQDVFANQLVYVRGNFFPESTEPGIAISLFNIPQDLVVGSVFFDDVNDMFKNGRLSNSFGNRYRLPVFSRKQVKQSQPHQLVVVYHLLGIGGQLLAVRNRDDGDRCQHAM